MRIHQLPPAIANQIAAGEVIERPASVVKELLENSLDAGATIIDIEANYGGLNQIKISDNGSGIVAEDLPLALSAHATSKISHLNDLYAIRSMGFRGEALASIASISKLTISSKPAEQEHAMMLMSQGPNQTISPCARAKGTTIEVNDLFFNAPVRKRFLKSERLEFQAIEGVVKRFALSAPHIALTLHHNNKLVLSLPSALNEQTKKTRMTKIMGSEFVNQAVFLDVEQGAMRLYGWISGVHHQRSQSDRQWVYINHRMVKDKLINHALKQAYDGLLYPGRFPSCLLYFTINADEVDVNVHPTKHEVRFQQPRLVHDFFTTQLGKALQVEHQEGIDDSVRHQQVCEPQPAFRNFEPKRADVHYKTVSVVPFATSPSVEDRPWTILNKQYSLLWIDQQPNLVDVTALYRSWLQHDLTLEPTPWRSRPLLVAVRYPLSASMQACFDVLQQSLRDVGLTVELADNECVIRSVPVCLPYLDLRTLFASLLDEASYAMDVIQERLLQAQLIDVSQLSREERIALSEYLVSHPNIEHGSSLVSKPLTAHDCRMLLCHL